MSKLKTIYYCSSCGAQSPQWVGRCNSCGEWNTFQEEVIGTKSSTPDFIKEIDKNSKPVSISEINTTSEHRMLTGNEEFDRVLGGGLVEGALVLIGGEPGIGKSTLMLQIALQLYDKRILYITGEESERQIKMRADRLGIQNDNCHILVETNTQKILQHLLSFNPDLVIVDSIQTLQTNVIESSAGSISQIRETASEMQKYAKTTGVPVILIGHITKDGQLAGPKILEHMVDTVLQFEGDRNYGFRIVRASKNRYGSASELGIFEMTDKGLRQVNNPSEILLSQHDIDVSGIAVAANIEGMRPMLIEIQSLVSPATYNNAQRSATGFDIRRLNMLLAVIEKIGGFKMLNKDVFLNIAGGIRVDDPAIDLAVVCAVVSSAVDIPIGKLSCFAAEVGLSGEVRPVNRIEQRIAEAQKLGFNKIYISAYNNQVRSPKNKNIEIIEVKKLQDVFQNLFA
ncbi:MAG: DNA repair protein RadA [Bacteroidales bacterium]|jgi:DNA repair protein RadA/Sms